MPDIERPDQSLDPFGPVPRDVFEKYDCEVIGHIDFWRGETLKAEAEVERLREAIRTHQRDLDRRAWGDSEQVRRDRDDIDNALYNATIGPNAR